MLKEKKAVSPDQPSIYIKKCTLYTSNVNTSFCAYHYILRNCMLMAAVKNSGVCVFWPEIVWGVCVFLARNRTCLYIKTADRASVKHNTPQKMGMHKVKVAFKRDNATMRQAQIITKRHANGMSVEGYMHQIEQKSIYNTARREYTSSFQKQTHDIHAMDKLYVDMLTKQNHMLRAGAIMLLSMINEVSVLQKAAAVSDKRAQRIDHHMHKDKHDTATLLLQKEAAAAQKTVDLWSREYKVADAKLSALWNVPVLPHPAE